MHIHPYTLAFVYFLYLTAVAAVRGESRARRASLAALIGTTIVSGAMARLPESAAATAAGQLWALILLLTGYHAAGAFFTAPDTEIERRLLDIDRRWLATRAAWPPAASALLEASYVSVYLVIPAGALVVLWTAPDGIETFWRIVLTAGFACYGVLPWVQTRPPRAIERPASEDAPSPLRRLNLVILARGSVGVNTLPSGHAATAVAVALAVWSHAPGPGALFLVLAILIAIATVAGRYHYLVDTVLGVAAGAIVWLVFD